MKARTAKRRVHYVLSTHWDREWYSPFQEMRYRLVKLMDNVLDGLASGRLKGPFQTDGQAVMLDDYLEIRPERRAETETRLREGQLVVGPWYAMPDEFTVSGESLIRNLRKGRQRVRELGGRPSDAGFVCDIFGHNSQLPQIFAGFGIRGGFVWRGINDAVNRTVRWQGADGTELLCYKFGKVGYCTYASGVRRAGEPAVPVADPETFGKRFAETLADEVAGSVAEPLLLFDGGDHQEWDVASYERLQEVWPRFAAGYEWVHSSLDDYLAELLPHAGRIRTVLRGELREPALHPTDQCQQWLIPGVLSSRVRLKQANGLCQSLLCQWAEPFAALEGDLTCAAYPTGFLETAWTHLLQNHPHDSIDGCSVDQVHKDMEYRFDQCRLISECLTREATRRLALAAGGAPAGESLRVAVFNPLPRDRGEVVELDLEIPTTWPTFAEFFGYEAKPAFRLQDAEGRDVPYQRLAQAMNRAGKRIRPARFPEGVGHHRVRVAVQLALPALGYTTLTAVPNQGPVRHALPPGLATSERSMANEFIEVSIAENGSLVLTDRTTRQTYARLLTFEDAADIGDGWYHGAAVNDRVFVSSARPADVALLHDGPLQTTFLVRTIMPVPARFLSDSMERDPQMADLTIESRLTLRAGLDYLDVRTTVDNAADDHRLRVLFPSGARASTYWADSPFDVVERPIALRSDNARYRELEVETKPQQSWTAVGDARRGLAVVAAGLLETAVRDQPERPLALTLFRSTRRTVLTNGEPGGQLRGTMEFAYRIVPFRGKPDRVRLGLLGQDLAAGIRTAQVRPADVGEGRAVPAIPSTTGLLRVDGEVLVSSIRRVAEGMEVRLFNPNDRAVRARIRPPAGTRRAAWRKAAEVDFESRVVRALAVTAGAVRLTLGPKKIQTVRLG